MEWLARSLYHGSTNTAQASQSLLPLSGSELAALVYRYRKHRGVNLGSWFVLERWITDSPFRHAKAPAQSDYDVAHGSHAKETLENHWDTCITEDDWIWIHERGLNAVRVPIGYYHLCAVDSSVLDGTDFAGLQDVFEGAWSRILNAISTAARFRIGVLLDLHAAPGKQNADALSGKTGEVHFYERENMSSTIRALEVLVKNVHKIPNVIGVQVLNEPNNSDKLQGWYTTALDNLRRICPPDFPLYIHDAWDTPHYVAYVNSRNSSPTAEFTVLDHHLYRCFNPADHELSGDQHTSILVSSTSRSFSAFSSTSGGNFIVGEFSAALNPASMPSGADAGEQDRQRRVFARAQLAVYEQWCGGWFFWTYKKKNGWDAGWSLRDAVRAEIMPNWVGMRRPADDVQIEIDPGTRDVAKQKALEGHAAYWSQYKGNYEHWRFSEGFMQGWHDAYLFFAFTPEHELASVVTPELGFKGQWIKRRIALYDREDGKNLWEYEHGFDQVLQAATRDYTSRYLDLK